MESKELVKIAVNALEEKKAEEISIIDIRGISVLADYFVVANAKNQNQLLAMQDEAEEKLRKAGVEEVRIEGNRSSTWILMDCGDIILHLFSEEDRLFYDLDRIWQDGKRITVDEL